MGDVVMDPECASLDTPPVLRVTTFGTFELQALDASSRGCQPRYLPVQSTHWQGGQQTLLKILLCSHGRQASKDLLTDALWSEEQAQIINTTRALDRIKCLLAQVLRQAAGQEQLFTTTGTDGAGYRLVDQRQLWVDADDFEYWIEAACHTSSHDEEAFSLWQKAYELVQGEFLPYDRYSEWSQERGSSTLFVLTAK